MKAFFLLALIFGALTFANAQTLTPATLSANQEEVVTIQTPDEWKEVKTEDLNESVQTAIKAYEETYEVNSIVFNEATKQTKVKFTLKSDNSEIVIVFNEEGKEVKEQVEE